MNITPRQAKILLSVIERYIQTAEPVSSKFLEESDFKSISSATIRNEMNDLERLGYLTQLHTSGGRIPTDVAYRFYVNNLMESKDVELSPNSVRKIKDIISKTDDEPREINKTIAQLVSGLSDSIVITNILEENDFYKTGLASLFEFPEFREFDRVFNIASIFDHFEETFAMIEKEIFRNIGSDLEILIGQENTIDRAKGETMIMARYNLPGHHTGSLTIIGPTRMDYANNISLVRCVIQEVNKKVKKK